MNNKNNNKLRLLVTIPNFIVGGAERVFFNIISNIDKNKFELHLVIGELRGSLVKLIPDYIKIYELGDSRAYKTFAPFLKLVWRIKPDIIFATLGFVLSAGLIKPIVPRNTKIVIRLGNTISAYLNEIKLISQIKYYYYYVLNYVVLLFSDYVIVQSNYMKNDLINIFYLSNAKIEKIIKINNPIDMNSINSLLNQKTDEKNKDIKEYLESSQGPKLISVGRFDRQKGYDLLIRSFNNVRESYPDAILIIIAEGELRFELEKLLEEFSLERFVFLPGLIENPYPYMVSSDIFVSSSRYEGFSNAILESLALGIPVVATDCPSGVRELIVPGKNGWLSSVNNNIIENLTEKIVYALENLDSINMGEESERIIVKYGIKNIVSKYETFFIKIAN